MFLGCRGHSHVKKWHFSKWHCAEEPIPKPRQRLCQPLGIFCYLQSNSGIFLCCAPSLPTFASMQISSWLTCQVGMVMRSPSHSERGHGSAPFRARTVRQLMQFVQFGWMNSLKWTIEPSVPAADIRRGRSSSQLWLGEKHLTVIKESSRKGGVGLLFSSPCAIFKANSFFHIFMWLILRTPEKCLTSGLCLGSRGMATKHLLFWLLACIWWEGGAHIHMNFYS